MANSSEDPVFKNLNADDIDHTVTEIESCCMNCYKNVNDIYPNSNSIPTNSSIFLFRAPLGCFSPKFHSTKRQS